MMRLKQRMWLFSVKLRRQPIAYRQLLAFLALPFVILVAIPYLLLVSGWSLELPWSATPSIEPLVRAVGVVLGLAGLSLFWWCVLLFARVGKGTFAPWDPTQKLVAVGPYRHVRNPMISSVAMILLSEAALLGSGLIAIWSILFVIANHLYFILAEEPELARRFGRSYLAYKTQVPRWLPRWRAWDG